MAKIHSKTARLIVFGVSLALILALVFTLASLGNAHNNRPAPPPSLPVVLVNGQAPSWAVLADCEDNGMVPPCWTIDDGAPDGRSHWTVVLSYEPYRALIMDDMVKRVGGDREAGA